MKNTSWLILLALIGCGPMTLNEKNDGGGGGGGSGAGAGGGGGSAGGTGTTSPFAVDCRGTTNLHDPRCSFVGDIDAGSNAFGQGPHITGTLAAVHRGFVDGNRLIVAMAT